MQLGPWQMYDVHWHHLYEAHVDKIAPITLLLFLEPSATTSLHTNFFQNKLMQAGI